MALGIKTKLKNIIKFFKKKELIPITHVVDNNDILKDKVAIIIGGSGGIGLSIAKSFTESGCKVVLCGTNLDKLNKCINEFNNKELVKPLVFDVSNTEDISTNISKAINVYGDVDILVDAAGVHTENVDFITMTPEEFDRVMNINVKSVYFICQEFVKQVKKVNRGGVSTHFAY